MEQRKEAQGLYTRHNASQDGYLPGGMLIAKVAPLDQNLPAGARQAGAAADEGAGLGPGLLHQHARLAAIPPLEVDDLALGDTHEQGLRHPLIVDVGLAYPLHQVLCLLLRAWHVSKPLLGTEMLQWSRSWELLSKDQGMSGSKMQMCACRLAGILESTQQ